MLRIPDVPGLDLGPEAGYPKLVLVLLQENAGILSQIHSTSFKLSNVLLTNHRTDLQFIAWATDNIVKWILD
jgi:hypothetical protein